MAGDKKKNVQFKTPIEEECMLMRKKMRIFFELTENFPYALEQLQKISKEVGRSNRELV
jgi:hypothetical protein